MTSGVNLNHFQMEQTLDRLPELFHFFTMEIRDYLFEDRLSELFHFLVGDCTNENTHIARAFPPFPENLQKFILSVGNHAAKLHLI